MRVNSVFGKNCYRLWKVLYTIGQFFPAVNGKIMKTKKAIWSHSLTQYKLWVPILKIFIRLVSSEEEGRNNCICICTQPPLLAVNEFQEEESLWGWHTSSVDLSAPTILPPKVLVPSTPSMLLSFIVVVLYLSCEKNENNQKEAVIGPFF